MRNEALQVELESARRIRIRGALDVYHYSEAEAVLKRYAATGLPFAIDLSKVTRLDTAGAMLLRDIITEKLKLENFRPEHKAIFNLVAKTRMGDLPAIKIYPPAMQSMIQLGRATVESGQAFKAFIDFLGQTSVELAKTAARLVRWRMGSITHHVEEIGINAIPIISLVAFVISVVIAYQGQAQLRPLGAEQFTVNLIAVSVLREMGVLLTAIMVAGRSGSAFASEIGVMKVRAEVDALQTIGLNPFELLVLPRLVALLIALPLLTFIADAVGLMGGGLMSLSLLDISMTQYLEQVRHTATWKDFFTGMIKAPVFALVIALVGCRHGLKVSGSAESAGKETTAAVVESIFLVLILDGFFSIYFNEIGL